MCGIAGIFCRDGAPIPMDLLYGMTRVLYHRGPDYGAVWRQAQFGLGHRRLKIIDLSTSANQPMTNETRNVWLSFNGEIYNYKDLKDTLTASGHSFRSNSDTEVIVHAYEEWGVAFLDRLNGMFSLGVVDLRNNHVLLARDRMGIKPLFYTCNDTRLLFASEIKSILMDHSLVRAVEPRSLDTYLSFNYVAAPATMFKDIHQVLPGEYILVGKDFVKRKIYWRPSFVADDAMTRKECDRGFFDLLSASVDRRLRSDVPFGAFLSGGLDSSSIVSLMSRHKDLVLKTFSIDFGEKGFSEADNSRLVSRFLGVEHHIKTVSPPGPDFFERLVWSSEEPTADSSAVPMHLLSEFARSHVTMVFSGDGGDELLGGYPTYAATVAAGYLQKLPGFLTKGLMKTMANSLPVVFGKTSLDYQLKVFMRGFDLPAHERHYYWRSIFDDRAKGSLYARAFREKVPGFRAFDAVSPYFDEARGTLLERLMEVDTRFYLPNDMLVKVDRSSMAYGLEVRNPFLDYNVVEFLARVPPRLKFDCCMRGKMPLKRVMKGKLPAGIIYQKKKGFNAPVSRWFRGPLKDFVHDVLSKNNVAGTGILNPDRVQEIVSDHDRAKADNGYKIYGLLVFILWREMFLGKPSPLFDRSEGGIELLSN